MYWIYSNMVLLGSLFKVNSKKKLQKSPMKFKEITGVRNCVLVTVCPPN